GVQARHGGQAIADTGAPQRGLDGERRKKEGQPGQQGRAASRPLVERGGQERGGQGVQAALEQAKRDVDRRPPSLVLEREAGDDQELAGTTEAEVVGDGRGAEVLAEVVLMPPGVAQRGRVGRGPQEEEAEDDKAEAESRRCGAGLAGCRGHAGAQYPSPPGRSTPEGPAGASGRFDGAPAFRVISRGLTRRG